MQSRRWIGMPCAAALVALVAGPAHATLIGQSVSVTLTDGGSLDASNVVVVGAGAEIAPGDGSAVGALLLPNESIDFGAFTIDVALGAAPSARSRRHPFTLVFRGPHAPTLSQRIHRLESARLGVLEIFLVPIEPDAAGRRYEAVFA